jgi:hypothetical protein
MADSSNRTERLIFPIGHYLGAQFHPAGTDAEAHVVRIGWELYRLDGPRQLPVWALAHGLPEAGTGEPAPWTRARLEGAARAGGIPDASSTVGELLERDLLVEVTPDTDEAVEFARACRTRSLLIGLGNSANDPHVYGIGACENAVAVRVPGFTYELWKWGHACDSLWHTCQMFAAAGDPAHPDESNPERVLTRCLAAIQVLLSNGAMHLDEARDDVVVERQPVA